jgi:hypothetical protein
VWNSSYGSSRGEGYEAEFRLNYKLPRETWLALGGYSGWRISVNCSVSYAEASGEAFDTLVESVLRGRFSHSTFTRYEEDILSLYTNPHRGRLYYTPASRGAGQLALSPSLEGAEVPLEYFECSSGEDLEVLIHQTLPREEALGVAREFFITGILPTGVTWGKG